MKWIYDGYTKVKSGSGRSARMTETWIFKCPDCGHEIRMNYEYRNKLPFKCEKCGGKQVNKAGTIGYSKEEITAQVMAFEALRRMQEGEQNAVD